MPSFNPCTGLIASPAPQRRIVIKPHQSPNNHHHRHHYRHHSNRNSLQPPSSIGALSPGPTSPGSRRRKDIGDYWLGKTLGKGSSGRVKLGIHKVSGEKVAIKIISKSHLAANASVERAVKREIAVMKLIHHPNIMSLLDVIDLSDSPNLYLILEYVQGGELFEYLVSQGRLPEQEARKYFQQIIFGLDYCHRHLICHRDLKPENLLLDKNKNIKIADFGMASLQPTGSLLETSCGSPHYASPEIVTGVPYNGSASDIWSCGIILYALLCGHLPFDDDNIRELLNKVKVGKYKMPDHISLGARDLIQKILVIRPEKRLTMKEVQQHSWFTADPPPNPSILPDPPTAKEIGRPISDPSEIDDRLLETLKVLWTDLTTEQVIEALLNAEYNMQKVTYVLLQRHATNYWQIDRDDDIRKSESPAKRRRPATICGVASKGGITSFKAEPLPGIDDMMHKIAANEKKNHNNNEGRGNDNIDKKLSHTNIKRVDSPSTPSQEPSDRNIGDVELPPPVPPKPIVIRADLIYNQARAEASASLKSPRPPRRWPYTPVQHHRQETWKQTGSIRSPSPQYRSLNRQSLQYTNTYNNNLQQANTCFGEIQPSSIEQQQQRQSYPYAHPINFPQHYQHPQQQQYYYPVPFQNPYHQPMFQQPQPQPHPYPHPYPHPHHHHQQQQQHLHIAHMLSPRAPSSQVMHNHPSNRHCPPLIGVPRQPQQPPPPPPQHHSQYRTLPSQHQSYPPSTVASPTTMGQSFQPSQPPPPPPSSSDQYHTCRSNNSSSSSMVMMMDDIQHQPQPQAHPQAQPQQQQQQPSKFNKLIHLWQRNRIEPVIKSPKASHRLSMPTPQTQLEFDRASQSRQQILDHHNHHKQQQQQYQHYYAPDSPRAIPMAQPSQLNHRHSLKPSPRSPKQQTSTIASTPGSPRLSSWLPGLFHFKQPKVCSIDCNARDEREAIGKISQVLEECMEGKIVERQDSEGNIRRKGEMTLPGNETTTKSVLLRFKVDVTIPSQNTTTTNPTGGSNRARRVRVNFIQQQGDAVALMAAVRMVDRTLQAYEQEANLIATANGWTPQPTFA